MGAAAAVRQSAAPAVAVARAPEPGRAHDRRRVQAFKVSSPDDAAEREAQATARAVLAMPAPVVSARARVPVLAARAPAARAPSVPTPPAPKEDETSPELTEAIRSELGRGHPLPNETREFMEPRFRANFSGIRIHTGGKASNLSSRLGARAFAYGRDIFFNDGAFQPDSPEGMELIAHELTHTIQQRQVVQREIQISQTSEPRVQRGLISRALDWVADKANYIPGFRLFTIVIGVNPINMASVDRSGANILRALIEFIPGGPKIVEALENHGVFQRGGKFIEDQFRSLGMVGRAFRDALMEFLDSLGLRDIVRPGRVIDRAIAIFTAPVKRLIDFGKGLVKGIADIVKDVILKPLGRFAAANVPKWNLLVGVFGKNPVSDEGESPASALIGAFMELIGQKEIWENIKKGNAVARAWAWFQGAMKGALSLVTSIPGRVMGVIRSLTIFDIVTIVGAFGKILGAFGSFVGDFMRWAGGTVLSLLEIILSVVAPTVVPYLKKAGGAFSTIIRNPIGFVRTLVRAGIQGFRQFASNFLTHLKAALIGWLTGSLAGSGVYIPTGFTLLEILKFVLSVMGLTWTNIRAKLVAATNETVVKGLETGFDIVKTLVTQGPAAAWEKIVETLTNLKQMAIDAVMDFVKSKVVEAAVTKLLSMLNPAGAFIQAIIAIYNTIMFFVERIRQIAQVAAAFIDGIAAIAAGNIAPAANRVEQTMAGLLTLVISFLARIAGLGKVSDAVLGLVKKIRDPIDKALDKVVAWIVATAKKLGRLVAGAARSTVSSVLGFLGLRKTVQGRGETHTLYFEQSGKKARLMIASNPVDFLTWLNSIPIRRDAPNRDILRGDQRSAREFIRRIDALEDDTRINNTDHTSEIQGLLEELGRIVSELLGAWIRDFVRTTPPVYGGLYHEFGRAMRVTISTDQIRRGTPPSVTSPTWQALNRRRGEPGGASYYIQGHLLNEQLGGPGNTWLNLSPLSRSGNAQHNTQIEAYLRPPRGGGETPRAYNYVVTPAYTRALNGGLIAQINSPSNTDSPAIRTLKIAVVTAEQYVPSSLVCSIHEVDESGRETRAVGTYTVLNAIDQSSPAKYHVA